MRNLMVTGGAGFIGSNFVRYMLRTYPDYRVVVYDKLTYAGNLENLKDVAGDFGDRYAFVKGDICDAGKVREAVQQHQVDTIVNFAAATHVDRELCHARRRNCRAVRRGPALSEIPQCGRLVPDSG